MPALAMLAGVFLLVASGCGSSATSDDVARVTPQERSPTADLNADEVEKRPEESVANVLQGRTSGADVTVNTDGSISVRIHGPSSFMANQEPLYVLDGTPIEVPGGVLRGINARDIESIRVLKYPHETAIYGVRGANGVIVITTRRPTR